MQFNQVLVTTLALVIRSKGEDIDKEPPLGGSLSIYNNNVCTLLFMSIFHKREKLCQTIKC
jgi:hypothetical protein